MTDTRTRRRWSIRLVLFLVMGAALAVGTWSVFTLLHGQFGAPKPVAFFGCLMFDAAALFFALLSQQYATSPDSGLAPRLAMLTMIVTSAWVNWQHAEVEHWGRVGSVVMAAAPIIAELAFEMWHRWEHREALRARGRVPEALPVLGRWAWMLHPKKAFGVVDAHIEARLRDLTEAAERRTAAPDDAPRVTVMREDAAPHQPAPHHLVIEVRQPAAYPAAIGPGEQLPPAAPQHDAPEMPAGHRPPAAPPPSPVDMLQRIDAALRGRLLSKADAVRAVIAAAPDATAPQIAQHLTRHGYEKADAAYVRTVQSRDRKSAARTTTDQPAIEPTAHGTGQYL